MNYAINIKLNDLVSKELIKLKSKLDKLKDINLNARVNTIDTSKLNNIKTRPIFIDTIVKSPKLNNIKDKYIDIKLRLLNKDRIKKEIDDIKAYGLKALALGATIVIPIKQSMDFELQFVDVKKVANFTDKQLTDIKKMIFKIASNSSATVKDITKITAEGIATGKIPLKDMEEYIKLANKAKVAFDVTNDQLGKAMNATLAKLSYSVKDTQKLFDMLNYSTNISSSKMVDMLNVLSRTAGSMKSLKTNEIATLINFSVEKGVSPETTASSINTIMNSLSEFNNGLVSKLKNKAGIDMKLPFKISGATAIKEGKGFNYLLSILKQIKKETNADKQYSMITSIFGKGEQKNLIQNFLNDLDGLENRLGKISLKSNWVNSVSNEFNQVEATSIKKIEKFKGLMNILMIKIGDSILSIVGKILSFINPIMQGVAQFASENKKLLSIILKIAGVITIAMGAFIAFKSILLISSIALGGFMTTLGSLVGLLGAITLPISLVGIAIYGLYKYWDTFKSAFTYSIDLSSLTELSNTFNNLKTIIVNLWNTVSNFFISIYNKLFNTDIKLNETSSKVSFIGEIFKLVGFTIGLAINAIINIFNNLLQIITWIIQKVQLLSPLFKALGLYIVNSLEYPISIIKRLYGYLQSIGSKISSIVGSVQNFKMPNFDISNKISKGWNGLKNKLGFGDDKKTINHKTDNKWNTTSITSLAGSKSSVDINLNAKGVSSAKIEKKRGYVNVKNINIE